MITIDDHIKNTDKVICRHIDSINGSSRGAISQDILAHLRNLVEHIMLKFYSNGYDISNTEENINKAIEYAQVNGEIKVLYKFRDYLQIVAAHYTLNEDSSERLMLKYYWYLLEIKKLVKKHFGLQILRNLSKFPLNLDSALQEYYAKIAEKIENHPTTYSVQNDKYYIQKIKHFFVGNESYQEITFTLANDRTGKSNRVIAFTKIPIMSNYASKFHLVNETIEILGKTMPIIIITGWEISIRDCEFKNFIALITGREKRVSYKEQRAICNYLTTSGHSLNELLDLPDYAYNNVLSLMKQKLRSYIFLDVLDTCRSIVRSGLAGQNIIRFLLYSMNNVIIKDQRDYSENDRLSKLFLMNGCIPFDTMPFINSPLKHNVHLSTLFECIPTHDRQHELLAKFIRNNTEIKGTLFTPLKEITSFNNIPYLVTRYNTTLYQGHRLRSKLVIENGQVFINEYKMDTISIINSLKKFTHTGIQNYTETITEWLKCGTSGVDCDEKKQILKKMFSNSRVAVIYGSAGVGKSTLINHISHFFSDKSKLYLAQTNPAVDNLKRRVTSQNCTFSTIASFLKKETIETEYDLLVIDECSTVSNRDMVNVLSKVSFHLILLVGDTYQISSIRFGNWFSALKDFVPKNSVFELTKPYRSKDEYLLTLWSKVRNMDDDVQELIDRQSFSLKVDESLFSSAESDEAILCLNYDGLYGINNINRFLQENNPNPAYRWNIQQYKVGDPVLFTESNRFHPLIYNNMKGRIVGIRLLDSDTVDERIEFDIELPKVINELDAEYYDFELLDNSALGNSVIRFSVYKIQSADEEDEMDTSTEVPFQVAYAISIHKAQGLEYKSVKIVITDEVDELITHNIFYTAITRAQNQLRIYWTPEVEHKILEQIKPRNIANDVSIIKGYIG